MNQKTTSRLETRGSHGSEVLPYTAKNEGETGSRCIKSKCSRSENNPVLCVTSHVPQARENGDNVHVWKHWTTTVESIAAAAAGTGCETLYYGVARGR